MRTLVVLWLYPINVPVLTSLWVGSYNVSSQKPIVKNNGLQRAPKTFNFKGYCTLFVSRRLTMNCTMWAENQMTAEFCLKCDLSQCHSLHSPPRIGIFLWWLVSKKGPWSRKRVIFKLKSSQKCYIFGDFLNCTMFNSSM